MVLTPSTALPATILLVTTTLSLQSHPSPQEALTWDQTQVLGYLQPHLAKGGWHTPALDVPTLPQAIRNAERKTPTALRSSWNHPQCHTLTGVSPQALT